MRRLWKGWVLGCLLVTPVVVLVGLGFLYLAPRRGPLGISWAYIASLLWVVSGVVFAVLAHRWTRAQRDQLLPLDWDIPHTFTPLDRAAWDLVQQEAETAETLSPGELTVIDTYIATGRGLARRLAAHYHPLATDPLEHVPIVEMLTALQLAAEDLGGMCRQVPGGDMVTPAHWKRVVLAAGWLHRANELYTLLLPVFQPIAGVPRLVSQKLMSQPAWKGMQENLIRWFYRAYVNRLGTHLIELYSGRLAIGASSYRRLTRKLQGAHAPVEEPGPMRIAVAGRRDSGRSALLEAIRSASRGDLSGVRARLDRSGLEPALAERLASAEFIEIPGYTGAPGRESARDRQTRRAALDGATRADVLLLGLDARAVEVSPEVRFIEAWRDWFASHPSREQPPLIVVLNHIDELPEADHWQPPYDWTRGHGALEAVVRQRIEELRTALPVDVAAIVPVGLHPNQPFGVAEHLLPDLAALLHRAERIALLRELHDLSGASKAGRLVRQVGRQGRHLWESLKDARRRSLKGG